MNLNEKIIILESIAETGDKGCTCLTLSQKVSSVSSVIRKFLSDNPAFFCKVGDTTKYMLNPSSEYNADVSRITAELRRRTDEINELRNDITFGNYF